MKFKILKEFDGFQTWYWTIPKNLFYRLLGDFHFVFLFRKQYAYDCWMSKEDAIQHIKRWNSGYYKKLYKSEYV